MSNIVPFSGLAPSGTSNNPVTNQLRRVGSFYRGVHQQQAQVEQYKEVAEHSFGLHKEAQTLAHQHDLEKITHTGREARRSATAATKNRLTMLQGIKSAGVDPSAPGVTRLNIEGVEIHTERPKPTAPRASRATKTP